mmetsp:Transcript_36382/g.83949  ORF Transcript_36382/g.83949 Transcript_36382/m.83949 type:complete len:289 (-) Transcript_36382:451-1317(-)
MPCIIWLTVASSSTYSAIMESVEIPAITCFHSPVWKSFVTACLSTSNIGKKASTLAAQRLNLSTASLPKVKASSSSSPSSSSSCIQVVTSSLSCIMKCKERSSACSMKCGILTIVFGLPSMKERITSKAYLREDSSWCDFAIVQRTGIRSDSICDLKNSAASVAWKATRTVFKCFASLPEASCAVTRPTSGMRGWKGFRSSFFSMLSTKDKTRAAASARTGSAGSSKHICNTWQLCEEFDTSICHTEQTSSLTIHKQSARRPLSFPLSHIIRKRLGIIVGHSWIFCGR